MYPDDHVTMAMHPCFKPEMLAGTGTMMYPEMYYKLHPHIIMACDEMDMHGLMMPTRRMMHCMCARVCDNIIKIHPELAAMDTDYPEGVMMDPPEEFDEFGRRFRRGPFRDLISFFLLSEFFRRRRRFFP